MTERLESGWGSDDEPGIPSIDERHRLIFDRVRELLQGLQAGSPGKIGEILAFSREAILRHFSEEQRIMTAAGYPLADAHAEEHARFARELLRLEDQYRDSPTSPWVASRVVMTFTDWLRLHVLRSDRDVARFLRHGE